MFIEALFMPVAAKKTTLWRRLLDAYSALSLTLFRSQATTSDKSDPFNEFTIMVHFINFCTILVNN